MSSEDYRTKHCSRASSMEATLREAHRAGPRGWPCGPGRVLIGTMPTDLFQDCLQVPTPQGTMPCTPQIRCMASLGRQGLRLANRSPLYPCTELAEPPGPRHLREEAGTGCLCRRLHLEDWMDRRAHGHLYSPHPCPGQTALSLPGAPEGTIPVPGFQTGPTARILEDF